MLRSDERRFVVLACVCDGHAQRTGVGVVGLALQAGKHGGILASTLRGQCHNWLMQSVEAPRPRVSIQSADFDLGDEVAALRADDARVGAVCTFVGLVRDRNAGDANSIQSMELEHYPGMTERAIEAMIDEALRRFDILGARVIHRVGLLQPLDQIVLVAVSSAHRGESFQACEFLMDYLKTQAPFWKKEQTPQGAHWVDARVSDDAALARWGIVASNS